MKKYSIIGILLLTVCILSGCKTTDNNPITRQTILFDTIIQIRIYDSNATNILDGCIEKCQYYENLFSRTVEGSDIYRINHADGAPVEVHPETIALLETALSYCELSDGAFDITLAPVSDLWDFQNNTGSFPNSDQLQKCLESVGYQAICINGNTVQIANPDTQIDLGAIAKGYIADQLKLYLKENGVNHALIDLGGNILTIGGKPDGSKYNIAIQKPFDEQGTTITTVKTTDDSVVTSGIYQRYVEIDRKVYHHILNPRTGYPYDNSLYSVTIISDSSTTADALSTTCFAMGLEDGLELINSLDHTEAIFITDNYELIYSDGLSK